MSDGLPHQVGIPLIGLSVRTSTDAIAFANHQMGRLREMRDATFRELNAAKQRQAYQKTLIRYGVVLGAIHAFRVSGLMADEAFERLEQEAKTIVMPRGVG